MSERDERRLSAVGDHAAAEPDSATETSEPETADDDLVQAVSDFVDDLVEDET